MQKIGRYTVEREIGRGEMGTVYLARDPVLERRVALKTVRMPDGLEAAEREEYLKRFYREAQAAGKLSHPGIVTIFDAGEDEATGSHYIAMEYIAGVTLKQFQAAGPSLDPRQAAFIAAGAAEALDYAHAHGVVHRDVKPANIILTDRGAVKLADFGIAKVPSSHLTSEGTYLGTPAYTSPEQVLGRPVDGRSDLFSLGIVLYELLSGRKPFPADNLGQLFHSIAYDPHPPLSSVLPGCPPALEAVTDRAMAKGDGERYATGREMARDLRAFLDSEAAVASDAEHPFGKDPGTAPIGPAQANDPMADLLQYLEETTRRMPPTQVPLPDPPTTRAVESASGVRERLTAALARRRRWAWLAGGLSGPVFWTLTVGAVLIAAVVLVTLQAQVRRSFPPGTPEPAAAPVHSFRSEMQAGAAELQAGRTEEALARFQAVRLRRPASPALARSIGAAMARLGEALQTGLPPPEQAKRFLDLGKRASAAGDPISAAEFIQAALAVEPANPDAAEALAVQMESAPTAEPAAAGSEQSVGEDGRLRLVFDSPAPRGYIMANVDGMQVLRKTFDLGGGSPDASGRYGRLEEFLAMPDGRHRLQVWITVKNKENYTAYGSMEEAFRPKGGVVAIRLDRNKRKLLLSLQP